MTDQSMIHLRGLTSKFTRPPSDPGFQENLGSAAPVQHLLGVIDWSRALALSFGYPSDGQLLANGLLKTHFTGPL
jgi:hypothetical protein